ncbi:hypothetical protein AYO20_00979 [Fonsecaea nubica]|uniref:Uncharacterized protein n=1 Tax=Fonsecaea nubica TaxID=856822 RepID=A0A178DD49_9EURO|nr:hypothetical protein AYO20_00979 [Fonsecaea nubica]OAL39582.1 hypothetical protein AYO20_00979 [Fonsecaea nubica]
MPLIQQRSPDPQSEWSPVVQTTTAQTEWESWTSVSQQVWSTSTPAQEWTTSSYEEWATSWSTQSGWITSYTATTDCACEWVVTSSSSWCPTPIVVTPTTTSLIPIETTPAGVIVVDDHDHQGLAPGVVGGIVLGAFFGVLLLVLLCICWFRSYRPRRYYAGSSSSSSSSSSHSRRRKPPVVVIDPYPRRPAANLTFVGGGNYPGTRVMVTKTQKTFVRPPPVRQVRTVRHTRRAQKIVVVED